MRDQKTNILTLFSFDGIKIQKTVLGIIKNAFQKNKNRISINEVDIKRIVLTDKKSDMVKNRSNTLLDI